ncbi:MAG: M24 family metallopeptidase [Candidatus Bathyarchaeia archaeon]
MSRDEKKLERIRNAMRLEGLRGLVLRIPENVSYLSDAWPGRGLTYLILPLDRDPILVHPSGETMPETWVENVRLYKWETYEHLGDSLTVGVNEVQKALMDLGIGSGTIGIEQGWEHFLGTPLRYEMMVVGEKTTTVLKNRLASYELKNASPLLVQARSIKTIGEVVAMRKVNRIARVGLEIFEQNLKPGLTEVQLSSRIEHEIVTQGVMKFRANHVVACAFVASGPSTAEAYKYVVGNTKRKMRRGELVMLELDVVADGYSSDTTRTFVVGKPSKRQRALLEAVLEAEKSAIADIRPGVNAAEIARRSIEVIQKHGLSDCLVHRLGHGIGVAVHEPIPALHVESKDRLKPGMVHSVEPGIYSQKFGGIRIEDDILDTESGTEYLSNFLRIQE